jgi:hypothetical protein
MVPLNLLLTLESIPFCFLHEELPMRLKRWYWWRSKDFVLFFTILVLFTEVNFAIVVEK